MRMHHGVYRHADLQLDINKTPKKNSLFSEYLSKRGVVLAINAKNTMGRLH